MISRVVDSFISKVNDDFQEAIEKLAVQSKTKISSATAQFEATVLDSQGNMGIVLISVDFCEALVKHSAFSFVPIASICVAKKSRIHSTNFNSFKLFLQLIIVVTNSVYKSYTEKNKSRRNKFTVAIL